MIFPGFILKNAEAKINELSGSSIGVIDLTFSFNPAKTLGMVAAYSESARDYYSMIEMTADVAYPFIYACLFGIVLTLLYHSTSYYKVAILPFCAMMFDYLENVTIITLLKTYPQQSETVATFCEIFKGLKWLCFGMIILLILVGLVRKLLVRFSSRETQNG